MDNDMLLHYGVLGMKWGVRRYQNADGSLTKKGKERYDRDIRENKAKKKDSRIDTSSPDPKRWAKEDLERSKKTIDATSDLLNQAKKIERSITPKPERKRLDLSNMTDQEMRTAINRELLERQYDNLFGHEETPNVSNGRKIVKDFLEIGGTVLTLGSSALGIALAIKELKS